MFQDFNVAEKGAGSYWPLSILRWVMVLIFVSFGIQKFTPQSAEGIAVYISNSPFVSWLGIFGHPGRGLSPRRDRTHDGRVARCGSVRPIPLSAKRLDGDRYVPHHLVVFLYDARRRQMEPLHGPDSVESRGRIPVQRHRASLRVYRLVFGVSAENMAAPSLNIGHSDVCRIAHTRMTVRSTTYSSTGPEWLQRSDA